MVHRKIFEKTGCTPERLRTIFTCKDATHADHKIRKKFEERIQDRIHVGAAHTMQFAPKWQAVDMAWDSTPILDETVPLMLWAQGKIKDEDCIKSLTKLGCADKYCTKEPVLGADGIAVPGRFTPKPSIPRLFEVSVNLIRSYCTRGMASQSSRFSNLWPYFKFEPRGTDEVARCRGDALSQRVDAMSDAYNYRHLCPQGYLQMFLYARSIMFVRGAWDYQVGWRPEDAKVKNIEDLVMESYCEREGVDFVIPHPSRVYWDIGSPLPNINTDNGPQYIGYWDMVPFRTLTEKGDYFNTDQVSITDGFTALIDKYATYFGYYFDPCVMKFPEFKHDPSARNDRCNNVGRYAGTENDKGCLLVQHFEKINPKREGIGELNVDVWMRLVVAGDSTIVAAEFLPSRPACYGGINENDNRLLNQSRAMELMAYQDQMTNLWSQMLYNIRAGMVQIWCVDKNLMDKPMQDYIKKILEGGSYYSTPHAFFYDSSKLGEAGFNSPATNPRAVLQIVQAQVQTTIETSMKAIAELLNLVERLMVISPNELGQPNPREVSARETTEIATSVNAISSFTSDGIDEQRAAMKRIIYESLLCNSKHSFRVPVINRYTAATIKAAGFELSDSSTYGDSDIVPLKTTIEGSPADLAYEYYFDSRDGADRPVNGQAAQALGNVVAQFMQIPALAQAIGKRRLFEWANEVTRLSGAAFDLKLDDGEDDSIDGGTPELVDRVGKIEEILAKVMELLSPKTMGQPGALPPAGGAVQGGPPVAAPAPAAIGLGDGQ
jgi:hypothetical protein